ncbi:hypothetical protein J4423_00815 [Candidatus Pacearchaeota archaeon]|nr:hypothetical protein [Candidatus Pacearchaeota archaeon]
MIKRKIPLVLSFFAVLMVCLALFSLYFKNNILKGDNYEYEICDDNNNCNMVSVEKIIEPSNETTKSYVDNWWNANGLIDECEMPPKSDMQFAFKQHDQSFLSHTGTIQVTVTPINYENNYLALQILIAEDKNNDNLPDEWVFCGNVDSIRGKDKRIINCNGTMVEFVKLVNPEWNPSSLYIDYILVLKAD